MIIRRLRIFWSGVLATISLASFAGSPPVAIGVVISDGSFQLNNAPSQGSATVTEGSSVVTGPTSVSIRLSGGGRAMFGADSRGTIYGDHLALDQGSARIVGYSATANTLRISAVGNASASFLLVGKAVQVTGLAGNVHVFSAAGMNVANLVPGLTLNILAPKPGVTTSSLTGCVSKNGDRYAVTDETSRVKAELRGGNVSPGEKIRVTGVPLPGSLTPEGLSQVLKVTKVTRVGGACKVLPDVASGDTTGLAAAAGAAAAGTAVAVAGTAGTAAAATVGAAAGIGTASVVAGAAVAVGATAAAVGVGLKVSGALSNQ